MRPLLDILTGYEGAIQAVDEDHSDENIEALELARKELMEVLEIALAWEKAKPAAVVGQKDFRWEKGGPK